MNSKVIQFDRDSTLVIKSLWMRYVWPLLAQFFTPIGSALFGALSYGAWTFFVNLSSGGYFIALRSGFVHAMMSFSITYGSVLLMRAVFERAATPLSTCISGRHTSGGRWHRACCRRSVTIRSTASSSIEQPTRFLKQL
jgi:hypothetical protein